MFKTHLKNKLINNQIHTPLIIRLFIKNYDYPLFNTPPAKHLQKPLSKKFFPLYHHPPPVQILNQTFKLLLSIICQQPAFFQRSKPTHLLTKNLLTISTTLLTILPKSTTFKQVIHNPKIPYTKTINAYSPHLYTFLFLNTFPTFYKT